MAIAMLVIGLVLGLAGLLLYNKFFGPRGGGDGMAISFSKHHDSDT